MRDRGARRRLPESQRHLGSAHGAWSCSRTDGGRQQLSRPATCPPARSLARATRRAPASRRPTGDPARRDGAMRQAARALRGGASFGSLEHECRRGDRSEKVLFFDSELASTCRSDAVVARLTSGGRLLGLRRNPALGLHTLEGGVKRSLFYAERVFRQAVDVLRNAVAVE